MSPNIFFGIILPFIGTTFGSAAVFFTANNKNGTKDVSLSGFAAGVMAAASVWSLIIPSVEMSSHLGFFAFFPMLLGFWAGVFFLIAAEKPVERFSKKGPAGRLMLVLAVVIHNIPEGMAVGVAFAAALGTGSTAMLVPALMLSVGMTLQNIPEGAIISLPLGNGGKSKTKAFLLGSLSGAVEPVFAIITLIFSSAASVLLPYLLGFAAGAMIYVCAGELIPRAKGLCGVLWFLFGFSVMMVLDVALG